MKIKLPNGATYGYDAHGNRVCTGSMMGRRNVLPKDLPDDDWAFGSKLHLRRLFFVDGCYDQGGAYWGSPANLYIATEGLVMARVSLSPAGVTVYVRARSRQEAKQKVRDLVGAGVRFYR